MSTGLQKSVEPNEARRLELDSGEPNDELRRAELLAIVGKLTARLGRGAGK